MILKRTILILVRCTGINLALLAAAALFDLLLSVFSFPAFTIACFAVAGVFSGVFCFNPASEQTTKEQRKGAAITLLIWIAILCALLFIVIAPLSGQDYNLPVKFFAVTEMATALFVWKNKFYEDVETPSQAKQLNNNKQHGQMKAFIFPALAFIIVASGYTINPDRKMECRIIKMTSDAGDTLHFLYDDIGRVQSVTEASGYVTRFNYYGHTIIATETNNGAISYKRIMTLGYNGMMSNLFEEKYEEGATNWTYRSYTFSGTKLTGITTVLSSGAAPLQSTLTWSGGNFISETSDDVKQELNYKNQYEYYTDKPVRPGDYWYINLLSTLGIGDGLYRNKSLLKSIRSGNSITLVSYEFDKEGKIISMTKTNGSNRKTWYYEYECK
jgi:YD repeat-containing protein